MASLLRFTGDCFRLRGGRRRRAGYFERCKGGSGCLLIMIQHSSSSTSVFALCDCAIGLGSVRLHNGKSKEAR